MAIQINPERINTPSRGTASRQQPGRRDEPIVVPKRAHVNFIPAPGSLATLVSSAVEALRKGVYWDRGTILNLLV